MSISSSLVCMLRMHTAMYVCIYLTILIFSKNAPTGFTFIPHTVTTIISQMQGIVIN